MGRALSDVRTLPCVWRPRRGRLFGSLPYSPTKYYNEKCRNAIVPVSFIIHSWQEENSRNPLGSDGSTIRHYCIQYRLNETRCDTSGATGPNQTELNSELHKGLEVACRFYRSRVKCKPVHRGQTKREGFRGVYVWTQ